MQPLLRKKHLLSGLILIMSLLGVVGFSNDQNPPKPFGMIEYKNNTQHIDSGIALQDSPDFPFFPSRASSNGQKLTIDMFEQPEVCGSCHTEIYKQWKGSMHSNAWEDPIYRAALEHVSKATGGKFDNLCMGCHTPIGVVTGEANVSGTGMSEISNKGVQCDFCHNVSASRGIGNGAFVVTPKLYGRPLKFGPFKDAQSSYHDTAYSELHTKSEFCGQCHNVTHPFNKMPIERTYDEWKDSVYAGEGIQCQDCHMTPGPGVTKNPGKATPFSKEREHIYTHYFVGGNVVVPELLGSKMHADMAREMLRASAEVEIQAPKKMPIGSMVTVRVKVTNVGAGHKLPTGFPEGREMWLDFQVHDADGKLIYRSGAVKNGQTEPETMSFKVVLGDKDGNIVDADLHEADRVLYDTRIPPKGYKEVEYMFGLGENTKGPLTITADLNYWSISQSLANKLLGKKAPVMPIILMTSAKEKMAVTVAKGNNKQNMTALPKASCVDCRM